MPLTRTRRTTVAREQRFQDRSHALNERRFRDVFGLALGRCFSCDRALQVRDGVVSVVLVEAHGVELGKSIPDVPGDGAEAVLECGELGVEGIQGCEDRVGGLWHGRPR